MELFLVRQHGIINMAVGIVFRALSVNR